MRRPSSLGRWRNRTLVIPGTLSLVVVLYNFRRVQQIIAVAGTPFHESVANVKALAATANVTVVTITDVDSFLMTVGADDVQYSNIEDMGTENASIATITNMPNHADVAFTNSTHLRMGNETGQKLLVNGTMTTDNTSTTSTSNTTHDTKITTNSTTNWTNYFHSFVHNVTTHWESSSPTSATPTNARQSFIDNVRNWWGESSSSLPIPKMNAPFSSSTDCLPVSLILFGVPKEFGRIWRNYLKHIVRQNPKLQFEVHMHMYSDLHLKNFTNAKNDEINITVSSPSDVQNILSSNISMQGEYENMTIPTGLVTSSQKEYDEAGLSWMEEGDLQHFSQGVFTNLDVLRNVFRQGNSMRQAYLSATLRPFLSSGNETNRTYVFLRSDTLVISPVGIPCSGLAPNEIHVPSWQTKGFPELNDRASVAGHLAAYKYARAKSDVFREMILDRRNLGKEKHAWSSAKKMKEFLDKKRYQFNSIEQRPTLHNPEKMLNFYLYHDELDGPKLKVVERDVNWMKLMRIRSGGKIADGGRWKVVEKYLNETDLRQ